MEDVKYFSACWLIIVLVWVFSDLCMFLWRNRKKEDAIGLAKEGDKEPAKKSNPKKRSPRKSTPKKD